jgi:hypothetical protein
MKKLLSILVILVLSLALVSCQDADVVSSNLSKEADNFRIYRRVVFYNSITNDYLLEVIGYASIRADTEDGQVEVTVKIDDNQYLKHYLGLSDNVTYIVEQLDAAYVSEYRYQITYKPDVIIPTISDESSISTTYHWDYTYVDDIQA